ncbi:hypothetical protein A5N86_17195 [Geobacillus thermoleovorans]|nr:hypothetical protein A5N86_17195 [Geobacillus thermoleovorans]
MMVKFWSTNPLYREGKDLGKRIRRIVLFWLKPFLVLESTIRPKRFGIAALLLSLMFARMDMRSVLPGRIFAGFGSVRCVPGVGLW